MSSRNIIIDWVDDCLYILCYEIDVNLCRLLTIYVLYWTSDKLQTIAAEISNNYVIRYYSPNLKISGELYKKTWDFDSWYQSHR